MPDLKLHSYEKVHEHINPGHSAEYVYRFRVPGGWMYIYSVEKVSWFKENGYLTSAFVPDPMAK
jgi:hypothetical protein